MVAFRRYAGNQCSGCKHFHRATADSLSGPGDPDECDAIGELMANGELTEQTALLAESTWFALADLDRCPGFEARYGR